MQRATPFQSDEQLETRVLDRLSDAVIVLDRDGRFAYWNPAADRLFRLAERQALGKLPKDAGVYPWPGPDNAMAASQAAAENEVWCGETAHTNGNGQEVRLALSITALPDANGAPAGLLAVIRDVTQAKRLELERARRLEELQLALDRLRATERLIPICAACKRIRDEHGAWHAMEIYIGHRFHTKFSHGICPACVQRLHPDDVAESE